MHDKDPWSLGSFDPGESTSAYPRETQATQTGGTG